MLLQAGISFDPVSKLHFFAVRLLGSLLADGHEVNHRSDYGNTPGLRSEFRGAELSCSGGACRAGELNRRSKYELSKIFPSSGFPTKPERSVSSSKKIVVN